MANHVRGRIEGGRRVQRIPKEQPPLISVVTAVYNGGATLERTILSVISQTFSNMEFIIIDGGSTDCSVELLRKYESSIDYWISEPDKGIYDALNKGISLAGGEWIYFLGADDAILNVDVFSSIFSKHYETKFLYGDVAYGNTGRIYGGEFSKKMLINENICQQGIFYRTELFNILGVFDLKYPLLADWGFNMKVFALNCAKPLHVDVVVSEYSLAGASSKITDSAFAKDRLGLIRKYLGYSIFMLANLLRLKEKCIANYKKYIVGSLSKILLE